jgi:hypothetical protein
LLEAAVNDWKTGIPDSAGVRNFGEEEEVGGKKEKESKFYK